MGAGLTVQLSAWSPALGVSVIFAEGNDSQFV